MLISLAGLASFCFSLATPIGEGPDEPAHLEYVRIFPELDAALAAVTIAGHRQGYELHQPPFYYFLASWWSRALGAELDYPLDPNPEFPHSKRGGAFLSPPESAAEATGRRGIRSLRWLGLIFGAATASAIWQVAWRESGENLGIAALAAIPFVLAPQLAFLGAVVSNDGLTFALCAWALWQQKRIFDGECSAFVCLLAGVLTAAAPWAKASGFFLLPTLLLAGLSLVKKKDWSRLGLLILPAAVFWTWWAIGQAARLESFRQSAGGQLGLWHNSELMLSYPWWWLQIWISYWAKLTWFQLRLPGLLYLFYLPSTGLVLGGLWLSWRYRRGVLGAASGFWAVALAANLALYAAFILFVDFQHQGRLLYPSLVAAVGLASRTLVEVDRQRGLPRFLVDKGPIVAIGIYFVLELAAVAVIVADEGWPRW